MYACSKAVCVCFAAAFFRCRTGVLLDIMPSQTSRTPHSSSVAGTMRSLLCTTNTNRLTTTAHKRKPFKDTLSTCHMACIDSIHCMITSHRSNLILLVLMCIVTINPALLHETFQCSSSSFCNGDHCLDGPIAS